MSDLYAGAYWGPRRENSSRCARRLVQCMADVGSVCKELSHWYEKGTSRRDALSSRVDVLSVKSVGKALETGRSRRDTDGSIIEDLGFHIDLWNGARSKFAASLSVSCGVYAPSPSLRNSVVLDLPDGIEGLVNKGTCTAILRSLVLAWEPEWAGVISRKSRRTRPFIATSPFVDWIIYIDRVGLDSIALPAGSCREPIDNQGTLIVVQDRPIDPTSHADMAKVQAVAVAINMLETSRRSD